MKRRHEVRPSRRPACLLAFQFTKNCDVDHRGSSAGTCRIAAAGSGISGRGGWSESSKFAGPDVLDCAILFVLPLASSTAKRRHAVYSSSRLCRCRGLQGLPRRRIRKLGEVPPLDHFEQHARWPGKAGLRGMPRCGGWPRRQSRGYFQAIPLHNGQGERDQCPMSWLSRRWNSAVARHQFAAFHKRYLMHILPFGAPPGDA